MVLSSPFPRRGIGRLAAVLALLTVLSGCKLPGWFTAIAEAAPQLSPSPATAPAIPAAPTTAPAPQTAAPTTTAPAPTTTSGTATTTAAPTTTATTTTTTTTTTTSTPGIGGPVMSSLCATGAATGPSSPPPGAVRVETGTDVAEITRAHGSGTTYWFATGTHAVTAAIEAQTADVFLGAPGAVLDGGFRGVPAFTGGGTDVVIRGLTIQRFGTAEGHGWVNGAAVNRSVAPRWIVENNTIRLNDGNALFLGDGSTTRDNCFSENGQTGLSAPAQRRNGDFVSLTGIVVTGNDVRSNNRNDLESAPGSCTGCTGGMKLWQTTGAVVRNNTFADNHGVGVWLDNNNVDTLVDSNVVDANDREGIMVETSYNTKVTGNIVTGNAVVEGRRRSDSFPVAGIFVSNSGGSSRVPGTPSVEVSGNEVTDNWNGVVVFWDADRYCGSAADTSVGHCTLGGATLASCASQLDRPTSVEALVDDCHWGVSRVVVHGNEFSISPQLTSGCGGRCGRNGLIASTAPASTRIRLADGTIHTAPNPLTGDWARARVADPGTNRFRDNTYSGVWRFDLRASGQTVDAAVWRNAGQDAL